MTNETSWDPWGQYSNNQEEENIVLEGGEGGEEATQEAHAEGEGQAEIEPEIPLRNAASAWKRIAPQQVQDVRGCCQRSREDCGRRLSF